MIKIVIEMKMLTIMIMKIRKIMIMKMKTMSTIFMDVIILKVIDFDTLVAALRSAPFSINSSETSVC